MRSTFVIDREGNHPTASMTYHPRAMRPEVFELVKQLETRKLNANR